MPVGWMPVRMRFMDGCGGRFFAETAAEGKPDGPSKACDQPGQRPRQPRPRRA